MIQPSTTGLSIAGNAGVGLAGIMSAAQAQAMSSTQIDKVSKDFESLFLAQMLESMFGDSVGTEAFGDEESSDVYKGLMTEEYGKQVTRAGGIGIADYVKTELLKLQEMHQ